MNILLIFAWIYSAMIATAFWESSVEGRNAWDKGKNGWKLKIGEYVIGTRYHFWFWAAYIFLLTLPFVIYGFNLRLFGIILSAAASGIVLEDFMWYIVNPSVKFREFWTRFSDYYLWIKINGKKIIPGFYILGIGIAILSWYFLWR